MKKKRPLWIPVVAGVIHQKDKILLGLRPEEKMLPNLWEFPGGKIELGEQPKQALRRELYEELGIQADIGELKTLTTHAYGETGILLLFYDVYFWKGQPKPLHHVDLKWFTQKEISDIDLPEANQKVLSELFSTQG